MICLRSPARGGGGRSATASSIAARSARARPGAGTLQHVIDDHRPCRPDGRCRSAGARNPAPRCASDVLEPVVPAAPPPSFLERAQRRRGNRARRARRAPRPAGSCRSRRAADRLAADGSCSSAATAATARAPGDRELRRARVVAASRPQRDAMPARASASRTRSRRCGGRLVLAARIAEPGDQIDGASPATKRASTCSRPLPRSERGALPSCGCLAALRRPAAAAGRRASCVPAGFACGRRAPAHRRQPPLGGSARLRPPPPPRSRPSGSSRPRPSRSSARRSTSSTPAAASGRARDRVVDLELRESTSMNSGKVRRQAARLRGRSRTCRARRPAPSPPAIRRAFMKCSGTRMWIFSSPKRAGSRCA